MARSKTLSHKPEATVRRVGREAKKDARKAAASPLVEVGARAGYVVRGLLYGLIGVLALLVAVGAGGKETDQQGTLVWLAGQPYGKAVIVVVIAGLVFYALWGFIRAIFDPFNRGDDAAGIGARLGFAWSGTAYTGLLLFAVPLALGKGAATGDGTQKMVATILSHPFGQFVAGLLGIIVIGVGIGQFVDAYRAPFRKDFKRSEMSSEERAIAVNLGRFGMFSRGVIFSLLGWFVVAAAIGQDAGRAHGYGGAFATLAKQPFGHVLLAVVALGFVALGLHSLASARWVRWLH